MRDYLLFYVNGKEHRVSGADAFIPLSDFLRYDLGATGTKVVCAEGDCGACSVLLGRLENGKLSYKPVNACIQYLGQLDCSHIISIEGLKDNGALNAVQESMVQCHGAQCGFCTPGFVVTMSHIYQDNQNVDVACIKECLSGNLCRCTGYDAIIRAGLHVDPAQVTKFNDLYPSAEMEARFQQAMAESVLVEHDGRKFFKPVTLEDATKFKEENSGTVIISGGTDVGVVMNKRGFEPQALMSLSGLSGLETITQENGELIIGSKVSLREIEGYVRELIPEFYKVLFVFGSPQIRWVGTMAGNIANASPIGDSLPFLFVMDAQIEVASPTASRRIKMRSLYKGYKQLTMEPNELITKIIIPIPAKDELLKLYKVSRREHLDISSFAAAIRVKRENDKITSADIAFGGVGPTIVKLTKVEDFLVGRDFSITTFKEAGKVAREAIAPLSDVRGSKDFRLQLAENVLLKFFHETATEREMSCLG